MQWFTIGPAGLEKLRAVTKRIRGTIGSREISAKVRGLSDDELHALLNDVLALVDEAEGILGRVREDTPSKALPKPFGGKPDQRGRG